MALLEFSIWLGILAAAGLTFPRRPVVSGFLFIALGVWSMILRYLSTSRIAPPPAPVLLGAAGVWFVIGIREVLRHPHS